MNPSGFPFLVISSHWYLRSTLLLRLWGENSLMLLSQVLQSLFHHWCLRARKKIQTFSKELLCSSKLRWWRGTFIERQRLYRAHGEQRHLTVAPLSSAHSPDLPHSVLLKRETPVHAHNTGSDQSQWLEMQTERLTNPNTQIHKCKHTERLTNVQQNDLQISSILKYIQFTKYI